MKKLMLTLLLTSCVHTQPQQQMPPVSQTPVHDSVYEDHVAYDKFTVEVCGMSADLENKTKKQKEECWKKHDKAFFARLGVFYPYGDSAWVTKKCKAYPVECKNSRVYESWARDSHNENVARLNQQQRQIAQQQDAERRASYFREYQQHYMQTPQPTTTQCRSYPVAGGVNTDCK